MAPITARAAPCPEQCAQANNTNVGIAVGCIFAGCAVGLGTFVVLKRFGCVKSREKRCEPDHQLRHHHKRAKGFVDLLEPGRGEHDPLRRGRPLSSRGPLPLPPAHLGLARRNARRVAPRESINREPDRSVGPPGNPTVRADEPHDNGHEESTTQAWPQPVSSPLESNVWEDDPTDDLPIVRAPFVPYPMCITPLPNPFAEDALPAPATPQVAAPEEEGSGRLSPIFEWDPTLCTPYYNHEEDELWLAAYAYKTASDTSPSASSHSTAQTVSKVH